MPSGTSSWWSFAAGRTRLKMPRLGLPSASMSVAESENVPRLPNRAIRPMIMPKSPTRLTMNALLAAVEALLRSIVKADQEVRADADQLPEHEHHRDVAGDDQAQHAEAEQRQVLEEAVEAAGAVQVMAVGQRDFVVGHVVQLVVHVADGVEVDARGDQRDHANIATVSASM